MPQTEPLQADGVYEIEWCCSLREPEDDNGVGVFRFTGEIDTWGKYTLQPLNAGVPMYLFAREITSSRRLTLAEVERRERDATYHSDRARRVMACADRLHTYANGGTLRRGQRPTAADLKRVMRGVRDELWVLAGELER